MSRVAELVVLLTAREVASAHRFTLLGWTWPLVRQLAQLGVLVLIFSSVLDLGIADYPAFVFVGLVVWTWFLAGLTAATNALRSRRNLVMQPGFPTAVLPLVAVAVALVDVLLALPVLVLMLVVAGELHAEALAFPLLLSVQFVLMCGLGLLLAAAAVHLRDVVNVVAVALTLLFYLTPVFYDAARVPERWEWLLRLNPMTTLLEADRAVLLGRDWPPAWHLAVVTLVAVAVAFAGLAAFRRAEPTFADAL